VTLFDLIMMSKKFGKDDWAALGRGEVKDEDTIRKMLMEGYEAMTDED
jgi:hypothetical protein